MTSLYLALWIAAAILLQLAVFLLIRLVRHLQEYAALKAKVADLDGVALAEHSSPPGKDSTPAWPGWRTFRVQRKEPEDHGQQVCSFYLAPEDGLPLAPFLPGQFLTFRLEVPLPQGGTQTVTRCYSLSNAPQPDTYRVSIKRAEAPVGSALAPGVASTYFHDQVVVGSLLQVRAPSGHFHIDRSESPVVLIGGGIGITPMLSMLNWCVTEQPDREVWLFYGVRHSDELVQHTHLESLAAKHPQFHLVLCLSDPAPSDEPHSSVVHHGRVDVALLRRTLPLKPYHFYICGPTPMLQSLVPALEDWGVPDGRIHFEAFGPASIPRKNAPSAQAAVSTDTTERTVMVNFAKSGKQFAWQAGMGSLLDFGEAHGIALDSGCRAGSCGSCQTTIQAGQVVYTETPDINPEPGTCLLCVCTPKTDLTLEA